LQSERGICEARETGVEGERIQEIIKYDGARDRSLGEEHSAQQLGV